MKTQVSGSDRPSSALTSLSLSFPSHKMGIKIVSASEGHDEKRVSLAKYSLGPTSFSLSSSQVFSQAASGPQIPTIQAHTATCSFWLAGSR